MDEKTDEQLAKMVQAGDIESFGKLAERYEKKLKRYAGRFLFGYDDGEDLVQDVFLKSYVNIQSFDPSRSFSSWIYRIAHNEFINAIKKKGREPLPFFDADALFPHPLAKEMPESELLDAETKEMLEKCLDRLDPKFREPLILHYLEEMNYSQISDILEIPASTVGVRIFRGKKLLKTIYESLNT